MFLFYQLVTCSSFADHRKWNERSRSIDEPLRRKNLLGGNIFRYRRSGICRSVGTSLRPRDVLAVQSRIEATHPGCFARWGLIPNWAKDNKITYKTTKARVETVDTAPSCREAFKKRRCLIPVGPVPGRANEGLADQSSCKRS